MRDEREAEGPGDPIAELARERFGVAYLQPYQRLVMANVLDAVAGPLDGEAPAEEGPLRQAVLLPTGFGKSLCFQLPALVLPGPTIVVYPILALMEDQRRRLDSLGIPCALFRGGQGEEERREAERAVAEGKAKIVITNPECLAQERIQRFLASARPSHVAIDEAHCVSEWGETFRPAYLELGALVEALGAPALSAFTATAGPAVLEATAASLFRGAPYRVVEGDPDRPNLRYAVVPSLCPERSLLRLVLELPRPLLVFCSSREGTRIVARLIRERIRGCDARFYHAGLERAEKKALEEWFFSSREGVLVATCAYGLGVDKKDIRSVLHYGPPRSVEAYLQEAGRAGRDGAQARAVLLSPRPSPPERPEAGAGEARDARYRSFLAYAEGAAGCRRSALLGILGCRDADRVACSGCDRCDGSAREEPEGLPGIAAFVAANPRRFEAGKAARLLVGKAAEGAPPRCAGWGALSGWSEGQAACALRSAIALGEVAERARAPWKGRLEPRRGGLLHHLLALVRGGGGLRGGRRLGLGRLPGDQGLRLAVDEADVAEEGPDRQAADGRGDDAPIGEDLDRDGEALEHGQQASPAGSSTAAPYSSSASEAVSDSGRPRKARP